MPVTPNAPAPYAPASAIIDLIRRHRSRGLPTPVNSDVLIRAGVSGSLVPRTLQALQALDLIDEGGAPSAVLEGIRLAPEAEYQQRVGDWLRAAYADALQFVDPATATDSEIRDAFRNYNPIGQQDRMVTLFAGLFREAGIGPERQRASNASVKPTANRPFKVKPRPTPKVNPTRVQPPPANEGGGTLPQPIAGLLTSLPRNGAGWSQVTRDRFMTTFGAVLDFCIPIVEETADAEAADTEEVS
ncbi:MAG: DUF5343 domain-containing protein, partial [Stellaceae bacterium]